MKQRTLFAKKRGFQCHFIVKVMVQSPHIAILTYNMYEHEDEQGWPCHGQLDTPGNARTLHKAKLSRDIVSYVESCYFLGVPPDLVYKMHIKRLVDIDAETRDRDFFLSRKDIILYYLIFKILNKNNNGISIQDWKLHKEDTHLVIP